MKQFVFILVAALTFAGCGRFLAAIPRHTEIQRPVTAQEIVGRWLLTTNSLSAATVDGFKAQKNEEIAITIRSDGSYSSHTIFPLSAKIGVVERKDEEGRWSLDYNPKNHFKNALMLRSSKD